MKKNAIASILLAFAAAFAPADNLGTTSLVGDLSSTSDYVYTADQADAVFATRVPTNRTVNGQSLSADVTITASDLGAITSVKSSDGSELASGSTATLPGATADRDGLVCIDNSLNSTYDASYHHVPSPKLLAETVATAKNAALSYTTAVSNKLESSISSIPTYTHPSYTARTGKPTANASPTWGGTFTVSQIKSDSTGHVTDAVDRTITIPSAAATTSAAGLMSAADKTALDSLSSGAVLKTTVSAALTAQGISSADNIDTLNETIAELKKIIAVLEALD